MTNLLGKEIFAAKRAATHSKAANFIQASIKKVLRSWVVANTALAAHIEFDTFPLTLTTLVRLLNSSQILVATSPIVFMIVEPENCIKERSVLSFADQNLYGCVA